MKNELINFLCQELTQIHEYYQGLPPYHAINRNNKPRKMFLFTMAVLTVLILLDFLPPIQ